MKPININSFKRIVLEPLEKDYKVIQTRVTNLETFASCPYKLTMQGDLSPEIAMFGKLVHNIILHYLYDRTRVSRDQNRGLILIRHAEIMFPKVQGKLWEYVDLVDWRMEKVELISMEYPMCVGVEMGDIFLIIEGTMDMLCKSENDPNKFNMRDLKTSASERSESAEQEHIQKYLYPRLFGTEYIETFDYDILTKHKSPRYQTFRSYPDNQSIAEFVGELLITYKKSVQLQAYPTHKSAACFTCPLYHSKTCSEWNGDSSSHEVAVKDWGNYAA